MSRDLWGGLAAAVMAYVLVCAAWAVLGPL